MLQAIDRLGKDLEYYAVDLSLPELERTFSQIPTGKRSSFVHGIYKEIKDMWFDLARDIWIRRTTEIRSNLHTCMLQ